MSEELGLVHYDAMRRELALAHDLDEVKDIRDKAEALRMYAKQAKLGLHDQNRMAEIKLRAERRAGQLLRELPRDPGGRPPGNSLQPATSLQSTGIEPTQAYRWQRIADIPQDMFEQHMEAMNRATRELTTASTLRLEAQLRRMAVREELEASIGGIPLHKRWTLSVADLRTYQTESQFDFIITDPPYPREYVDLYESLAERALEWLKPQGLLLAMCGHFYLDQIMHRMTKHLTYYWTGCYLTPGQPTPLRQRQVNTSWKPILVFALPSQSYKGKTFGDVWKSVAPDKTYHAWGQSVSGMLSLIRQVCLPGQSIFDPCCGAAATGVAALQHGCLFEGIDIDAKAVAIARARLSEVTNDTPAS